MSENAAGTGLQIGRMDGRLIALESRMDRHEIFVGSKLATIENKLDDVLMAQASGNGGTRATRWIVGIVLSIAAWLAGHLTQPPPGSH